MKQSPDDDASRRPPVIRPAIARRVFDRRRSVDWQFVAWGLLWGVNGVGLAVTFAAFIDGELWADWHLFVDASRRLWDGTLYDSGAYLYSPLFVAWVMPLPVWIAAHFAALLLLPRRIALLTLVTFPFWLDLYNAGVMTFLFVAAWHAVHRSQWGSVALFLGFLLAPRPPLLPVLTYVLWKQPRLRLPFVAMCACFALVVSPWLVDWVGAASAGNYLAGPRDFGPARIIGAAWIPIGMTLAAWLTLKGRVGLATVGASPYWTPMYAMLLLLELREDPAARRSR